MKHFLLVFAALTIASQSWATDLIGYANSVSTTESGLTFTLGCAASSLGIEKEMKEEFQSLQHQIADLQCDVSKIRNPTYRCLTLTVATPTCGFTPTSLFISKSNPNYSELVSLVAAAYTTRSQLGIDATFSGSGALNSYTVNHLTLQ